MSSVTSIAGPASIGSHCDVRGSRIGLGSYLSTGVRMPFTEVGRFCSIADGVRSCLGLHPTRGFVSTHPAFFSPQRQAGFTFVEEAAFEEHRYVDTDRRFVVRICNDVWIGSNAMIMDGLTIHDGAVVGAGAVVTHDVPPYTIVAGVPAREIGTRFEPDVVAFLLELRWWDRSLEWIREHAGLFRDVEALRRAMRDEARRQDASP